MANNPYVNKVQLANGTTLIDITDTTAVAFDVAQGKYFYTADGKKETGTGSGGAISIVDTPDAAGGVVRTITALNAITGTKTITENGTGIDVASYALVDVNVPTGEDYPVIELNLDRSMSGQVLSLTCSKTYSECVTYFQNRIYYAIVKTYFNGTWAWDVVGAMYYYPNETDSPVDFYIETTTEGVANWVIGYSSDGTLSLARDPIPSRTSSDMTASGATVTAPAGYYASNATTTVASGTAGTPTATKGTVSNHSVSVTPSVTNTTGYITGGTQTGTAVTIDVTELESGTKSITQNGTGIDVTSYAQVDVNVPTGEDYPVIELKFIGTNSGQGVQSITCSKTHTQCVSYFQQQIYYAVVKVYFNNVWRYDVVGSMYYYPNDTESPVDFYIETTTEGVANWKIRYTSDGTLTWSEDPIPSRTSSDLTASTLTVTAPAGYYASNATKTLTDQNLSAENIKKDITIFGVTGTYEGGGTETIIVPEQTITVSSSYTPLSFSAPLVEGDEYTYTINGLTGTVTCVNRYGSLLCPISINGEYVYFDYSSQDMYFDVNNSSQYGTYTVKLAQQSGGGGSTLITKSISANGTYDAEDDDADGYSSVTVTVPTGTARTSSDLTASNLTVTAPAGLYASNATKTLSDANLIAGNIKSGTTIFGVTGSYTGSGSSKNIQYYMPRSEISSTTYVATSASITVSKAGSYKCYWAMDRNTTSGTTGTQLYKNGDAVGSAHTTWTYNGNNRYGMECEETLTFAVDDVVVVRARSRNASYICGVSCFVIVEQ